jgi:hypothetical protein
MGAVFRVSGLILLLGASALAADNNKYDLSQTQIDDIIQKFAAKEAQFAKAREVYTYRQTARIQELDDRETHGTRGPLAGAHPPKHHADP